MGHLVLAGGGHAHMQTLEQLDEFVKRGHRVTVVGPSPYHYYSGMGPGMLGGFYSPDDIRFATLQITEKQGGTFVHDKVERIDPDRKRIYLVSGDTIDYDVLSCNLGSQVPHNLIAGDNGDIYPVKPIEKLHEARQRALAIMSDKQAVILVAGGGPAAAEIAGNLFHLAKASGKTMPTIYMCVGKAFMSRFPGPVSTRVYRILTDHGIVIDDSSYVKSIKTGTVILESGKTITADLIFVALGVKPSPVFAVSDLPVGPDGGLSVNRFLQSSAYPEIFGGGDCIYFQPRPLDKVGVYAVRQNPVLYHNLMAALEDEPLMPFHPGGDYLLIFNLGDRRGVLRKKWLTLSGRTPFILKDFIDRRFIKRFRRMEKES